MMTTAFAAALLSASAQASAPPPLLGAPVSEKPDRPQPVEEVVDRMHAALAVDPLTPEQEARLPLARELAAAVLSSGFYVDVLHAQLAPLFRIGGLLPTGPGARLLVSNRTGQPLDAVSRLTDDALSEVVNLLAPAARQRAEEVARSSNELVLQIAADVEPSLRDAYAQAFAAQFSETDLHAIRRFAATSSGAVFFRQFFTVHTDPRVKGATLEQRFRSMAVMPQIGERFQAATAKLPKPRNFAALERDERERLARLLGISVAELQQSMQLANQRWPEIETQPAQ